MIRIKLSVIACFLFALSFYTNEAQASHIMGVDITYECLNNCTIRVYMRTYRDCTGASGISNNISFNAQTPGCGQPQALGGWSQQQTTEVTPLCPGAATGCTSPGASINGVQEYYWFRDYNICNVPNCIYTISWGSCCRNGSITSGQSNQGIGVNSTTLNTNIIPCNSSPQFANPPVPYICQGLPYTFNQGATDPEGDSLAYTLGPCYTSSNGTTQVNYNAGYSPQQPLGPDWIVTMNAITGDISVVPNPASANPGSIQTAVMCVYVEEWRNGQLINTIVRDIQMTVIPCPGNTPPTTPGVTNVTGGSATGPFNVTVCAGTQLSFQLPIQDPDQGQTQTVFWNQNIPGATFTSGAQSDTIVGNQPTVTFTWTPNATGIYTFLLTAQDDACPILGSNQNTIIINVQGGLPGAGITVTPTGCTNVSLTANPGTGNTGPYVYSWSGDGNLNVNPNNTAATLTHTYPGPGSYEVNVQITDNFGCVTVLTDTAVIAAGPTADAGPDISLCSGNPITLGSTTLPTGQSYTWSPATGLNNTTIPDPTLNYTVPGTNPVNLTFTMTATSGFCTSIDYVDVTVFPTPTATIAGPNNICIGDQATLTASGGTSYLWSTSDVTNSITVSPTQTTTYTVTAIANGCSSPVTQQTINVTTGPTALITGVDSVCTGGSTTLTATGGTNWVWSTNETTQTITLNNINSQTTVNVVASDNGCAGPPATFTVDLHATPASNFTSTTVCIGEETQFTDASTIAIGGNGGIIAWNWDFDDPASGSLNFSGTQNPSHQFTQPGLYNVELTVTGYNGCTNTVTRQVVVNALPVPEFETADVCDGEPMVFADQSTANSGIVAWLWDFGTGIISNLQNPTYTFPGPGTYNVILTVTDGNGCVNQRERTVLVHPNPVSDFFYTQHCFFTEARFFATSFLNDPLGTTIDQYQWNFGDPASGADNTATGPNVNHFWASGPRTYNVTLTTVTSRGCTNSITIPVAVPVIPPIGVKGDTVCRGFPATLEVLNFPAGTELEWFYTPDATDPFLLGDMMWTTPPLNVTTTYYVAVRDADGCLSPKTGIVALVRPETNVELQVSNTTVEIPNAIVEFNLTGIFNGALTSQTWDFGDGTTSNAQQPVHEYSQEGVYDITLSMVNEFGCASEQSWPLYIEVTKLVNIFVPSAFTPNGDGINDEFNVVTRLITDFQIDIYDRWGKLTYSSENMNFRWTGVDASGQPLSEGVYTYVINAVEWDGSPVRKTGSITVLR
ncbi:MAG: PKD domain-containing protein [Bacteroidota bacterium]